MLLEKIIEGTTTRTYKAKVKCELCNKIRIIKWWTSKLSENHICKSCSAKITRTGKKASEQAKKNMSKAQRKKGYRTQGNGYKGILIDNKDHPRFKSFRGGGYIMEHILIMEKKLGRFLEKNELIHHIDKNKLNNDINNLYIFNGNTLSESRRMHQNAHQSAEDLTIELYKLGIVEFVNGVYKIKNEYANKIANLVI